MRSKSWADGAYAWLHNHWPTILMEGSKIIVIRLGYKLALICLFLVPLNTMTWAAEWEDKGISQAEANLVFYGPGLEGAQVKWKKGRKIGVRREQGLWRRSIDTTRGREARMWLYEVTGGWAYIKGRVIELDDQIRLWHKGRDVVFLDDGTRDNALGRVDFRLYQFDYPKVGPIKCLGLREYFGAVDFGGEQARGGGTALGDKVIFGYYCVAKDVSLSPEVINAVIDGIGYKGFAVPSKPPLPPMENK